MNKKFFQKALPVWLKDKENEMNTCVLLEYHSQEAKDMHLIITGATFYQVFVNEKLIHYGPARKAHGYAGVDDVLLSNYDDEINIVIKAVGYNCKCFNGAKNTSFIQAEILCGDNVIAATGYDGFNAYNLVSHLQKVMRYSYQRQFSECWDYTKNKQPAELAKVNCNIKYVERKVPYCDFDVKNAINVENAYFETGNERMELFGYLTSPISGFDCFDKESLESNPFCEYLKTHRVNKNNGNILQKWDFGKIETGFFSINVNALTDTRIILAFSEQLDTDERCDMFALKSVNVVEWKIPKGEHTLITLEPYVARYAELLVMEGETHINNIKILELAYPKDKIISYYTEDKELMMIYNAAVNTFRHNAFDIYMDCPSRERAGWLFDSYYTGKTEISFTGRTMVEDEFLNNYVVGGNLEEFEGMVSMCYPADSFSKRFIPQWSMWYILEIYEYVFERGNADKKEVFKKQIIGLSKYFEKFENEFGLLEKLESWNFIEWSEVNNRVYDVSWATNMLYCAFLSKIGLLYDMKNFIEKSEKIKSVICNMAFDGKMFVDRAVRNEAGKLKNTDELSEVTQYYALKFDIIDINDDKYSYLKNMVLNVFGKDFSNEYPNIEPANAIPGLYLRMELLLKWKKYSQLINEIKQFYLPMAIKTSTLWEHKNGKGSRNHGFASFVGVVIKEVCNNIESGGEINEED